MEEAPKAKKGKAVLAFFSGAALASVVTLLTAPASGKMTRRHVAGKARKAKRAAVREVNRIERNAERQVKKLRREAERQVKLTSKDIAKRAQVARHAAEERFELAREKLTHASNGHANGSRRA